MCNSSLNKFACCICGKSYSTKSQVTTHLKNSNDLLHSNYYSFIQDLKVRIDNLKDEELLDEYTNFGCLSNNSCSTCERKENCCREEIKIFNKLQQKVKRYNTKKEKCRLVAERQEQLKQRKLAKEKAIEEKRRQQAEEAQQRIEEKRKKKVEQAKQRIQRNRVKDPLLAREIYEEFCFLHTLNKADEVYKIYGLLQKYTETQVRQGLDYLKAMGHQDLTYFGRQSILEGEKWYQIQMQLKDPKSIPSLIKDFFKRKNVSISNSLFFRYVNKFNCIIQEYELTVEQIDYIFDYANKYISKFRYIESTIPEILQKYTNQKVFVLNTNKYHSADYYLNSAIDDLKVGSETFDNIIKIYGHNEIFKKKVCSLLEKREYNNKYSAIEWLYRINLPLTKDIYFLAKKIVSEQTGLLYHFDNESDINKFKQWLRMYKNKFEN